MRIYDWNALTHVERRAALSRPAQETREDVQRTVQEIIAAVRRDGDSALRALTARFDGVRPDALAVTAAEFAAARAALSPEQHAALERAIDNVQRFHAAQMPQPLGMHTEAGVHCERLIRAISAVGLYVPAGSAPLPSAVIMLAVPARLAGCAMRLLCTPPDRSGSAHAAVLVAAEMCGVKQVFKVGGAQAIAALAYGTATIPRVAKIFGPGNVYVTAAKQLVANDPGGAACDLPAGPSEVMVVADDAARADFVAADLLAQAEHDTQAQAILVCLSRSFAETVCAELARQAARLSRQHILAQSLQASRAIVVADLKTATALANEYAPEHLLLQVPEPRRMLADIHNAGSVFLGSWSPEPLGDYCSGTNHVLPTYGYARAYGGLSVLDFLKGMTVQELSAEGLQALGPAAVELARLEGLDAHASAVSRRLEALLPGEHA